jgi:dynein light intermediate chain 1, cytosolic
MRWELTRLWISDGASLIYTTSFDSNNVRTLIHSSLGIQSLLKREIIKHNVIDRDKILIPPNWDSWGKIRILREGFEIDTVANAWSVEIQAPPETEFDPSATKPVANGDAIAKPEDSNPAFGEESTISIFTSALPNPFATSRRFIPPTTKIVTVQDSQTFLAEQAQILEMLRQEDEQSERSARKGATPSVGSNSLTPIEGDDAASSRARISEQTGPYNINVGGIQVDAEEVTRRIREREADRDRDNSSNRTPRKEIGGSSGQGSGVATPDGGKVNNEALANYFAGLMKKAKGASESPRGGSGSGAERWGGRSTF